MTDWYTDEIFSLPPESAVSVRFLISRLALDPERFLDDEQEVMASRGMGVVYTRTSQGAVLRASPTVAERTDVITRFYVPHHAALSDAVDGMLATCGHCLLVDCHSFPSHPLPYELDQDTDRPLVCLGTDKYHTPVWLVELAQALFEAEGLTTAIDRPFSGALVTAKHLYQNKSVFAIMVELNRSVYMNESSGAKLAAFQSVVSTMQRVLRNMTCGCSAKAGTYEIS